MAERKDNKVELCFLSEAFVRYNKVDIKEDRKDFDFTEEMERSPQLVVFQARDVTSVGERRRMKLCYKMLRDVGISWENSVFFCIGDIETHRLIRLHNICRRMSGIDSIIIVGQQLYRALLNMRGSPLQHFGQVFHTKVGEREVEVRVFCSFSYWRLVRRKYLGGRSWQRVAKLGML